MADRSFYGMSEQNGGGILKEIKKSVWINGLTGMFVGYLSCKSLFTLEKYLNLGIVSKFNIKPQSIIATPYFAGFILSTLTATTTIRNHYHSIEYMDYKYHEKVRKDRINKNLSE